MAISVENRKIFPPTRVFCAHAGGVSLEIGYWRWESKTRMMSPPGREKNLTTSSAVLIQYTNVTDGPTDGPTPNDSKDRAYT